MNMQKVYLVLTKFLLKLHSKIYSYIGRSAIKANEKNQVHYQNLIESSYNKSNVDLKITISSFTDDNGKTFNLENAY